MGRSRKSVAGTGTVESHRDVQAMLGTLPPLITKVVDFAQDCEEAPRNPRTAAFRESLYQSIKQNGWNPRIQDGKADIPTAYRRADGRLEMLRGNSRLAAAKKLLENHPVIYAEHGLNALTIQVYDGPLNPMQYQLLVCDRDYGQQNWDAAADRLFWENSIAAGINKKMIAQLMGLSSVPSQHERMDILRQFPETSAMVDEWIRTRQEKERNKYIPDAPIVTVLDNNFISKLATEVTAHLKANPAATSAGETAKKMIAEYNERKAAGKLATPKTLSQNSLMELSRGLRIAGEYQLADALLFAAGQQLDPENPEKTLLADEAKFRTWLLENTNFGKSAQSVSATAPAATAATRKTAKK